VHRSLFILMANSDLSLDPDPNQLDRSIEVYRYNKRYNKQR
jgi:hypothetical protein